MSPHGRTLKIFVTGSTPTSLKTVELVNWSALAFFGGRSDIKLLKDHPELAAPGIYILLSESGANSTLTHIYIGETDDFTRRVVDHAQSKDWWGQFIVFTTPNGSLTKAHVKFLEKELYDLGIKSIGNLVVKNTQIPGGTSLPKPDVGSMKEFLDNMIFVLETLGLSYFTKKNSLSANFKNISSDQQFQITLPKELTHHSPQLKATMEIIDGVYILKKDSPIRRTANESFLKHDSYHSLWTQIVGSDSVTTSSNTDIVTTTKDIEFRSPSAAGAVVRARTTNGRVEWKRISDQKTLHDCELELSATSVTNKV